MLSSFFNFSLCTHLSIYQLVIASLLTFHAPAHSYFDARTGRTFDEDGVEAEFAAHKPANGHNLNGIHNTHGKVPNRPEGKVDAGVVEGVQHGGVIMPILGNATAKYVFLPLPQRTYADVDHTLSTCDSLLSIELRLVERRGSLCTHASGFKVKMTKNDKKLTKAHYDTTLSRGKFTIGLWLLCRNKNY